jgi:hypothetical protein
MARQEFTCAHCEKPFLREKGQADRCLRRGDSLYCSRECSAIGRRKGKTIEQKRAEKAEYDADYRSANREKLKAKKAAYYARTFDRDKEREIRKRRMPQHIEYCRRPEYKEWKREYDRNYSASEYGAFAGAYLVLVGIQKEILSRATRYEIDLANGKLNKVKKRKHEYAATDSRKSEERALGNSAIYQK